MIRVACLALVLLGLASPSFAQDRDGPLLVLSAGQFDSIDGDGDEALEVRLDYRSDYRLWIFRPLVGAMVTSDAAVHVYAGIYADLWLGDRVVLTGVFAPGLYEEGDGRDLGHAVEFRSQVEVAYRFDNGMRLGLALSHLSNAGLDEDNPGVETLAVTFGLPTSALFGR